MEPRPHFPIAGASFAACVVIFAATNGSPNPVPLLIYGIAAILYMAGILSALAPLQQMQLQLFIVPISSFVALCAAYVSGQTAWATWLAYGTTGAFVLASALHGWRRIREAKKDTREDGNV